MPLRARFEGGSLDGTQRQIQGCHEYVVPLRATEGRVPLEFYRRSRVLYVDGAGHANEVNRERVAYVVMTFNRLEHRPWPPAWTVATEDEDD